MSRVVLTQEPELVGRGVLTPPSATRTLQHLGGALGTARPTNAANRRHGRAASFLAALFVSLGSAPAPAVEPFASYIFPAGGQRGTSVPVRVGGCYFHADAGFELLGPGITAPARIRETNTVWFEGPLLPQPGSQRSEDYPRDHAATLRIAADAPLGARHWRVWTSQGATPALKFLVGDLPEVIEAEQDGAPLPVAVTPPVTINGRIFPREDVDVWTFPARAGQTFTLAVAAQSFGSPLQARLEVLDPAGAPLAEAVASQRDPQLQFTAPRAGTYSVRIHDVSFGGLQHYVYRLTITDAPVVTRVFPLGGQRGETVAFELAGANLPTQTVRLKLPAGPERSAWMPLPFPTAPAVLLELGDLPELQFPATGRADFAAPALLNGRLPAPGATNAWHFSAKKGDALELTLAAARLDSPLTPVLAVTDADGKVIARAEAAPGDAADLALNFKAPADGDFLLHVSDRFASRAGPAFAYRLRVAPAAAVPDFQLTLAVDALNVIRESADGTPNPKSGKPARGKQQPGKLKVNALATGGFKGDIELTVEGLPPHVTVSGNKIATGKNTTDLQFAAEPEAKIAASRLTVRGTATVNGTPVTRTATLPAPRGEAAVESALLAVTLATPFRTVSEYLMQLAPRGSVLARPYQLERGGFTGPITVRLADRQGRHLQGVTASELVLPPDAEQFVYTVNLAPFLDLGRTSRSQVMLYGRVRDHDGSEHIISFSANEQNDQVIAVANGGLLDLAPDQSTFVVTPGVVKIPFRLRRERAIATDAVRVELHLPAHLTGVRAAAVTIPATSERGVLEVQVSPGAGPFNAPLTLQATSLDPKNRHLAQAEVEFIPAPAKSAQARP